MGDSTRGSSGKSRSVTNQSGQRRLSVVPRLDELAADPEMAETLDAHALDSLTAKAVMALNGLVHQKLTLIAEKGAPSAQTKSDRLITAKEVAKLLGVSAVWVYHHKNLPFEVRLGTVRRFSENGLAEVIRKLRSS